MAFLRSLLTATVLLQTCVAAPAANSRFTYYPLLTPLASPCDLNDGPDGDIYASTFTSNKLVHINRHVNPPTLEEITIPYTGSPLPYSALPPNLQGVGSCVVQPGEDGNVYYATGIRNQLVQYNPKTRGFKFFENTGGPLGNLQPFNDMWPAKDGMWFTQTTANVLTFFDFATQNMTSYEYPTPASSPVGVIIVPNGDIWTCEFLGQKIAKFDPKTKKFTEYPVPPTLLGPAVTRAFTDNKYIWFTAITTNALGRVDITNGQMTAFPNTANLGIPIEDTNDANGNVWYSTALSNTLNYLTPHTGKFTSIPQGDPGVTIPGGVSLPPAADIAVHWSDKDNSIWFTELANNRVGKYALTGKEGK